MRACRILFLALFLAAFQSAPAAACGFCTEDKIAAVYDYALIKRTLDKGGHVAFCSIKPNGGYLKDREDIFSAFTQIDGVNSSEMLVSLENLSLSFAFNPSITSLDSILRAAEQRLRAQNITLEVLQVTSTL